MIRTTARAAVNKLRQLLGIRDVFSFYPTTLLRKQTDDKPSQILLSQFYRGRRFLNPNDLPRFDEIGFRQYSQNDEDGILLYIFALIGTTNKRCLEICAGDGIQCNTANLIINHGWWGTLFDGAEENVRQGIAFYASHPDTFTLPPTFKHAWITAENVTQLITECGLSGEIDLLSLDLDGIDYWIWKAIEAVDPRVVVCEYHNPVPPDRAVTVPYDPNFKISSFDDDFRSASLKAMANLGRSKGYRLVGTNRFGFNAFFIKNGIADALFLEATPEQCSKDPYTLEAQRTRWSRVKDREWIEV